MRRAARMGLLVFFGWKLRGIAAELSGALDLDSYVWAPKL